MTAAAEEEKRRLAALARGHVRIAGRCSVNAAATIGCLVAEMAAGADSIDDMGVLRHGAMPDLFEGVRAPSTLGSFLRSFTWGNVRQLEKVHRELLAGLAGRAPLLPGAGQLAFIDMDSMQRRVYGHAKQGAAFGHTKIQGKTVLVRGLNALAAVVSTPQGAPVVAATRLRGGSANTGRGAASLLAEAIGTARAAGCTGIIVARMDSGYYSAAVCRAARRAGAFFSVTARLDAAVKAAIAAIPEQAWTAIRYPRAIWDDQLAAWVSDAEIAEISYTGCPAGLRVTQGSRSLGGYARALAMALSSTVTCVPVPCSGRQLNALGQRLADGTSSDADHALFAQVADAYQAVLDHVERRLRELGFEATTRVKTTGTLLDKLRRDPTLKLRSIHDLAGARIVIDGTLDDQDAAKARVIDAFASCPRPPVEKDRR